MFTFLSLASLVFGLAIAIYGAFGLRDDDDPRRKKGK